jgi:hypothetical protein
MIDALKALVEQAEKLSPAQQEALAEKWRRELEELAWDQAFYAPGSLEMLLKRRDEVLAEDEAGETEEISEDGFLFTLPCASR